MHIFAFPVAVMTNVFAMMVLMIALSLFGKSEVAAEVGLVHGATVALFYSFSGNARSLIISDASSLWAPKILRWRMMLLVPLCIAVWLLCTGGLQGREGFIALLILRRAVEWLAEVFLSEQERHQRFGECIGFTLIQCAALVLVSMAIIFDRAVIAVTFVWACSPLLSCMGSHLFRQALVCGVGVLNGLRKLLPHFGSTLAIGASVYIIRLFMILLLGKQSAGDLFAAFALGGIMGAVFSQALGATMVRNEASLKNSRFRKVFNILLLAMTLAGITLAFAIWHVPELLAWTSKSHVFWMAVSCSLVGGTVMVLAQQLRLQLLQNRAGCDVFGSDVLANLLLVGCVPLLFFGMGEIYLASLYLVGAVLSLVFYLSEDWSVIMEKYRGGRVLSNLRRMAGVGAGQQGWGMLLLVIGLFTPMFIQWGLGLYHADNYYDSGGRVASLPIPLSVVFCCAGIVLMGGYARARRVLLVIFSSFVAMCLSVLVFAQESGVGINMSKLILMLQYLLPMFALIAGVQAGSMCDALRGLARGVLAVLLVVISLQLVATVVLDKRILSESALLFGVYQGLQYVPVIFVGGYLIALHTLWCDKSTHAWLLVLGGLIGAYAALSISVLALFLLSVGGLIFVVTNLFAGVHRVRVLVLAVLLAAGLGGGVVYASGSPLHSLKFNMLFAAAEPVVHPVQTGSPVTTGPAQPSASIASVPRVATTAVTAVCAGGEEGKRLAVPLNLIERLKFWDFYLEGVQESWKAFLLGHERPPERSAFPSAHNYYLDLVYNFGFLALVPLLMLMLHTLHCIFKRAHRIFNEPGILAVTVVVLFILLIDNSLKVGMRQPYPGIVSFFLWGFLLAWLWRFEKPAKTSAVEPRCHAGRDQ